MTHLVQLIRAAEPRSFGISEVVVWGSRRTLQELPSLEWLKPVPQSELENSLPVRFFWQRYRLHELAKASCDLLLVPGGSHIGEFRPYVTMFQNMLVLDTAEANRYGASWMRLRLAILRSIQISS